MDIELKAQQIALKKEQIDNFATGLPESQNDQFKTEIKTKKKKNKQVQITTKNFLINFKAFFCRFLK